MSQKNYKYTYEKVLYYIFFDFCYCLFARNSNLKTQSNWYRKSYKVTNDTLYTYIQLLNWEFMSRKKLKERNMMGKMKNELMIQKNMLCVRNGI